MGLLMAKYGGVQGILSGLAKSTDHLRKGQEELATADELAFKQQA